jgi:predicted transcriptional regulator of viral defense system
MKYREVLLEQLKYQPYFSKKDIYQLSEQYELKSTTVDTYISRSLKRKEIITLKNGLYVSADFYNKNKDDISYSFYLANILRKPSYVSSWTALQYYNLTTEVIHTITSITPKVTRAYKTKIGNFSYQSIKKELFSDFSSAKGKFDFFIASPAKALFDLLYFKTHRFRGMPFGNIKPLVAELRIDIDEMSQEEQKKFYTIIKNYTHHE